MVAGRNMSTYDEEYLEGVSLRNINKKYHPNTSSLEMHLRSFVVCHHTSQLQSSNRLYDVLLGMLKSQANSRKRMWRFKSN